MIIDCISDLHGSFPKLDGGDLLIVAGDLTARDTDAQHLDFIEWLGYGQKYESKYKKVIYIAGNHDGFLDPKTKRYGRINVPEEWNIEYLCDSGTEFQGLNIWGSPWSLAFPGMNPKCKAFTLDSEEELKEKWALIPDDIDILVTHSPPMKFLDLTTSDKNVGSPSLSVKLFDIKPALHVFGHIHEAYGEFSISGIGWEEETKLVNASIVNERYEHVNKPIRVIL